MTTTLNTKSTPWVLFPHFQNSHKKTPTLAQLNHDVCELILIELAKSIFFTRDYSSYSNTCLVNKTWRKFFIVVSNQLWNQFPLYPILEIGTLYRSVLKIKPKDMQESLTASEQVIRQVVVGELVRQIWREEGGPDARSSFRKRFEAGAELHFILYYYSVQPQKRQNDLDNFFNFFSSKLREDTLVTYQIGKEESEKAANHSHPLFIAQRLYSRFKKMEYQEGPIKSSYRNILKASPVQTLLVMRGFGEDRQTLLDNCCIPHLVDETLWNHSLPTVIGCLVQWQALATLDPFHLPELTKDLPPDDIARLQNNFANQQIKSLEHFFRNRLGCKIPVSILPFMIRAEVSPLLTSQLTDYFISRGEIPAYVIGMLRFALDLSIPRALKEPTESLLDYIIEKSIALDLIDSTELTGITLLGMLCRRCKDHLVARFLNTLKKAQHPFDINLGEPDEDQNSPLHYASGAGAENIWFQLIENGADRNVANAHGETPILNYLQRAQSLDTWNTHLPSISFQALHGQGLQNLRVYLKQIIAYGRFKPNFADFFPTILKKILDESPDFLNEDIYSSLFFASVIFCPDHALVKTEIEFFKNETALHNIESSEFHPVAGFSDERHIPFLREWLESTMKRPISWLSAAKALWQDDCFKGTPRTIIDSVFREIYSKDIPCKYSLKEIKSLILCLNDERVNLFKTDLKKVIKKTNKQKKDLVCWLAKYTKKPLSPILIQALIDQEAKLDALNVIHSMGATHMREDLLEFLLNRAGDLSDKKLSILEETLQKWRVASKEIGEPSPKRELMANIRLLDNKIIEAQALLSPGKQEKGKEAATTPSPLKRTVVQTPPGSTPHGEKRKSSSALVAPGVKRRLVFSTPPPSELPETSSSSTSNPEAEGQIDFPMEELFQAFHSDPE